LLAQAVSSEHLDFCRVDFISLNSSRLKHGRISGST
jgi:hypothetical protein